MNKEQEGNRIIKVFMNHVNSYNYHNDWNHLMPVVEKIEKLPNIDTDIFPYYDKKKGVYSFEIGEDSHNKGYGESSSKIEAVWLAVVEFINWYNQNKHL